MFTGLVEESGWVERIDLVGNTALLTVECSVVHADAKLGDSIAVNGCCLTVVEIRGNMLTFEAVPETMDMTNLSLLKSHSSVNLERPMRVGDRLGGHIVQGHIDGVGIVHTLSEVENAIVIEIEAPSQLRKYIIAKGSIAVDGVSLTVAGVANDRFTLWVIPHTRKVTTLGELVPGCKVNIETDMIGKYVESLLGASMETVSTNSWNLAKL